jgi:hypothetical protein
MSLERHIENNLDTINPNEKWTTKQSPQILIPGLHSNDATTYRWVTFLYELTGGAHNWYDKSIEILLCGRGNPAQLQPFQWSKGRNNLSRIYETLYLRLS